MKLITSTNFVGGGYYRICAVCVIVGIFVCLSAELLHKYLADFVETWV